MNYLLDTHTFLWLVWGQHLSQPVQQAFLDTNNQFYLSAASYWEICIKIALGKLTVTADWAERFEQELTINGIRWLGVEKVHCQQLARLPLLHRDPFDRLLIAQAVVENMTLVSSDEKVRQYPVSTLW